MTSDLSENQVYLPYEDATKLLGLSQQEVTQVTFGVKDPEKIDALLKQVKAWIWIGNRYAWSKIARPLTR